jgi:hypothetical protein
VRSLAARASIIIVFPDKDARPDDRYGDVDTIRERIQNVIEIVTLQVDVFGALWPENDNFRTVVGNKEDVDASRITLAVLVLATVIAIFIVVIIVVVVVMMAALHDHGIGFDNLVSGFIAGSCRRALQPR